MVVAMVTTPSTVTATTSSHFHTNSSHSHTFFARFSPTPKFPIKSKLSSINACKNHSFMLTTTQSKNFSGHVKNPMFSCKRTSSSAIMIVCLAVESGGEDNADIVDGGNKEGDDAAKGGQTLNLISEADLLKKKAKKVMKRRKRLLRKRRLRKKGRWPPSKMAKLKNV